MSELKDIEKLIFSFFCNSSDYNGIPLRQVSRDLDLDYEESIDLIKEIVETGVVSIQSSTNPHIIGFKHHPVQSQLDILEHAKSIKVEKQSFGNFELLVEQTEYPICLYPTPEYVKENRDISGFGNAKYSVQLALSEPQMSFRFFETDILERYSNEPRFAFEFNDFSGQISCKYDDEGNPILREEDQIFLKSFGLGFDSSDARVVAVMLCDLGKLSYEHQVTWGAKEIPSTECKVLDDYFNNLILGQWITSKSVFTALIDEINAIYKLTESIFGVPLFLKALDGEHCPKNFTFFFSPTSKNYYDFINLLDKYLSENINKSFFEGSLELEELRPIGDNMVERVRKGTLRLLEEWLAQSFKFPDDSFPSQILKPLKDVRKERQKPAHKVIENGYDPKFIDKQKKIIESCYISVLSLRKNIQTHPEAESIELNASLDDRRVKYF